MRQDKIGRRTSNFWTDGWMITFDNYIKNAQNKISLCSGIIKGDDQDDMQIKDIVLYKLEP